MSFVQELSTCQSILFKKIEGISYASLDSLVDFSVTIRRGLVLASQILYVMTTLIQI